MAIQWQKLWEDLNERQRHFLRVLYRRECELAAYYTSQRAMADPRKKRAEWRWMRHNGEGGLARDLDVGAEDEAALCNNQGSGATYKALEERALLERRWEHVRMFSFARGEQTVSLLDVRLTPTGRRLVKTAAEGEAGPAPAPEKRRELERKAWGKARFRGHVLGDWQDVADGLGVEDGQGADGTTSGVSVAACRLCGQEARVDAAARKAAQVGGPATERDCGGWAANPRNPECRKALERAAVLGLDRLAGLLREKRGERGYREAVSELEAQGLGEIGASDLSRAEHGRPVADELYRRLCRWVGMVPGSVTPDDPAGPRPAEREGGA